MIQFKARFWIQCCVESSAAWPKRSAVRHDLGSRLRHGLRSSLTRFGAVHGTVLDPELCAHCNIHSSAA
jgi:hypothetical protein